jgi:hypothetical protein
MASEGLAEESGQCLPKKTDRQSVFCPASSGALFQGPVAFWPRLKPLVLAELAPHVLRGRRPQRIAQGSRAVQCKLAILPRRRGSQRVWNIEQLREHPEKLPDTDRVEGLALPTDRLAPFRALYRYE